VVIPAAAQVVIADPHPLFLEALVAVVKADQRLELAAVASDGLQALEAIRRLRPDVAVLDINLPVCDGAAVARRMSSEAIESRVLFLSELEQGEVVYDALAAGGTGYVSKRASKEQIADAIAGVANGEAVLSREASVGVIDAIRRHAEPDGPPLARRELEVLRLIAAGHSSAEIGERLHLAVATVKTHTQSAYRKLGVSGRAAAVAEAMRRGVLD
jgi:two-component system, NarL family, nitrate/nitrite response regulator NarL